MPARSSVRYEIRGALPDDEDQLLDVARHLDSVNLPHDRDAIRRLLAHATESFEATMAREHRKLLFVLRDVERDRIAGASMIVAKLGRPDAPYIYVNVFTEEKYSKHPERHFRHTVLRVGYSYDGPTEIGGLIVAPDYRRVPERLGRLISYVRFLYIARHRDRFEDELLAELLPPLEPDGTSLLWESFGRRFTGMTYRAADWLSSHDKDFIRDLFPSGFVYASLFDPAAQAVIGKVGRQTKGVEKMLRRIGFRYAQRIDPFDGGPHFVAATDEVTLIQRSRSAKVAGVDGDRGAATLVSRDLDGPPWFRCLCVEAELVDGNVRLPAEAAHRLDVGVGDRVDCLPLE